MLVAWCAEGPHTELGQHYLSGSRKRAKHIGLHKHLTQQCRRGRQDASAQGGVGGTNTPSLAPPHYSPASIASSAIAESG